MNTFLNNTKAVTNSKPKKVFFVLGAILLTVFILCCNPNTPAPVISANAYEFSLPALENDSIHLKHSRGKTVLLVFWASWCQPCLMEIPTLNALYQNLDTNTFEIIGVNIDEPEIQTKAAKVIQQKFNIQYPIALGNSAIVAKYGNFQSIPTSFLIDAQGTIKAIHRGIRSYAQLEQEILTLQNPQAPVPSVLDQ
jgi:cytochrome c biogenesis protein CcmG, thiol:disulfide interchange protein DsbE